MYETVTINRKAQERLASGHPWIFESDVTERGKAEPGAVVRVLGQQGRLLGVAHYSSTSQITLRLLARRLETVDLEFYRSRLERAAAHRRRVVDGATAYRLVHAEGDLLPGLIVDVYGEHAVVQLLDQGMDRDRQQIAEALLSILPLKGILARNDVPVRKHEELSLESQVLFGEIPDTVHVEVNGFQLLADLRRGQKTGVYLDQRENYLAARRFAHGKALDCFTSTGGFALHVAAACEHVEAVDSSAGAIEAAGRNARTNGIANIHFREADVFEFLAGARRKYDTIVLDPPAFAKNRASVESALRGYREINTRALKLLEPGGVLTTCSCSFHVSEADLLQVVAQAALDAGRTLRVLDRRSQAQDHPILLTVPETHYLKCLILEAF